jgi:membrane protease YdiL (CAAX protease family)
MNAAYDTFEIQANRVNIGEASPGAVQPMGWRMSLLLFGVPSILSVLAHYVVTPLLVDRGLRPFYAQILPNTLVLASLLIASVIGYWAEGRQLNWAGVKNRFRLDRMTGKKWVWVAGGTIAGFTLYYLVSPLGSWLVEQGFMPLPDWIPAWLDPRVTIPLVDKFNAEAGGLRGNWLVFIAASITFFFNIIGEEFWWRGYILPRQELAFGKRTWLVHAVLWSAVFHAFKYWDIGQLPAHFVYVYVASRMRSTTVAILLHILTNVSFPLFILLGVLGIGI